MVLMASAEKQVQRQVDHMTLAATTRLRLPIPTSSDRRVLLAASVRLAACVRLCVLIVSLSLSLSLSLQIYLFG